LIEKFEIGYDHNRMVNDIEIIKNLKEYVTINNLSFKGLDSLSHTTKAAIVDIIQAHNVKRICLIPFKFCSARDYAQFISEALNYVSSVEIKGRTVHDHNIIRSLFDQIRLRPEIADAKAEIENKNGIPSLIVSAK
ncbi:hypothetical protein PENTCL1PPCAC_3933, partial [Pristionchus entomophagus]